MDNKELEVKTLVFNKFIEINEGYFSFNSELKSLIDEKDISIEDALYIIFDLMYDVIIYNLNEKEVNEEFKSLIEKVKEYNVKMETSIKKGVLFYKDYSHEKELFIKFSSNLKFNEEYVTEINSVINNIKSKISHENSVKKNELYDNNHDTNTSLSLKIRERKQLDKELRILSKELRKQHPYNWREILEDSDVYKRKHGLEINENADFKNKTNIKKLNSGNDNKNDSSENESNIKLSEKELKKLKIRSDYLSNLIKNKIKKYSNVITKIKSELHRFDGEYKDDIQLMLQQLNSNYDCLIYYQELCHDYKLLDKISEKINNAESDLKIIEKNFEEKLSRVHILELKTLNKKLEEYDYLIKKGQSILYSKLIIFSELNSKLDTLINNINTRSNFNGKKVLLDNLERINLEFNEKYEHLDMIDEKLSNKNFSYFVSIQQANTQINILSILIDELDQLSTQYFEEKISEQENIYQNLLSLTITQSENIEGLLKECDKYFNRKMFRHRLKKFNLIDDELVIIKNNLKTDIVNQEISGENINLKEIIEIRCEEFRKNNHESNENEISDLLNSITFHEVDDDIVNECKNKVNKDLQEGNITTNQVELKLRNYVNKKIDEDKQLKELDKIKNDPNIPKIKIHLSQGEMDEIYSNVETEILDVYGINGDVESRVSFWVNQKIRDNQSEARGRLNSLKRDFSNLTQLSKNQQLEFIYQIEFYINENMLKPYDITEENIITLSKSFKNYGKLKL